jgi:cyclomaltodextrinase
MQVLYNSRESVYKTPFGCIRQDELCRVMIRVSKQETADSAVLRIEDDMGHQVREVPLKKIGEEAKYHLFSGEFSFSECGLYYYYFHIDVGNQSVDVFRTDQNEPQIGIGGKWQLTCYQKDYQTPPAFHGKVMYQIFPDRFRKSGDCDLSQKITPFSVHEHFEDVPVYWADDRGIVQNNDFFGGNLKGIIDALPYLVSLHVSVIYLNPIFKAYSNHRYDTCDYKQIDPMLGTEEDFSELCVQAHRLGIKILLDGVFSHTGDRSVYFDRYGEYENGAYLHSDSPYRSWFQFDSSDPNGYHSWWGIRTLPCTEEMDPGFLDYVIDGEDSVAAHWIRLGADGFRLDVADELPDEFIERLHRRVKQLNPDAILLGEVWEDASNKISYSVRRKYFVNTELDSVMNYPFKDAIIAFVKGEITVKDFSDRVMTIVEHYPKPVLDCVMNSLSTHDTIRILSVLGTSDFPKEKHQRAGFALNETQRRLAVCRLKAAVFLQFMLPGCPCIYYGDEAGMEGLEDPFNRRFFPWGKEDRTIQNFYRRMAEIKVSYPQLQTGSMTVLADSDGVFMFSRVLGGKQMIGIVCLREEYDCFTSYSPVVLEGGRQEGHRLVLNQYGFVLFEAI